MKRVLTLTCMILLTGLVTLSCSKEKRIERRLASKSGKWNIETYTYQYYEDGALVESGAYSDIGYFIFDEDGTVVQTYTQDGTTYSYAGTWSNTRDEITFIEDGDATVWKITDYHRNEMTLEFTDVYSINGIDYRDVYVMKLEKDR
jgi:hypothetical protein